MGFDLNNVNKQRTWVDPHIHFFALDKGAYAWLKPNNPPFWADKTDIARNHYEVDLTRAAGPNLSGFVHVEAGFDNTKPWREIEFLEGHCRLPFRSVACIDLSSKYAESHINKLAGYSSVVGLRDILDDNATTMLNNPKAQWLLGFMAKKGLSFDAQFDLADTAVVKALLRVLERYPSLRVIVDHSAVAPLTIESLAFQRWTKNIASLTETEQVAFKFSGLEMQDRQWCKRRAQQVLTALLANASCDNVMLASNYPLCTWRMPYQCLWKVYHELTCPLSEHEKMWLFENTAKNWYRLT